MLFTRTFTRDNGETEVAVEYSMTGGSPAVTSGPPEFCDPGEAPEVEIESVTCLVDGADLVLTDAEAARAINEAYADLPEDDGPDPDDWRDQMIDDRLTGAV